MAVARDDFEAIAEDRLNQIRPEHLERCAVPHDPPVRERDDA